MLSPCLIEYIQELNAKQVFAPWVHETLAKLAELKEGGALPEYILPLINTLIEMGGNAANIGYEIQLELSSELPN